MQNYVKTIINRAKLCKTRWKSCKTIDFIDNIISIVKINKNQGNYVKINIKLKNKKQ